MGLKRERDKGRDGCKKIRSILNDLSIDKEPEAGSKAMVITAVSKMFHGSFINFLPWANILMANSATKTPSMIWSINLRSVPYLLTISISVSRARIIALIMMSVIISKWVDRASIIFCK